MRQFIDITKALLLEDNTVSDRVGYAVSQFYQQTNRGDSDYDSIRQLAEMIGKEQPEYQQIMQQVLSIKPKDWDRYAQWLTQVGAEMNNGIRGRKAPAPVYASSEQNVDYDPYERDGYHRQSVNDKNSLAAYRRPNR